MNAPPESRFEQYVREYTELVQDMLGTGKITSEDQLKKYIFKIGYFLSACDAFCFITQHAPFTWKEIVSIKLLQNFENDLVEFVKATASTAIAIEIHHRLLETDGFRFLMGDKKTLLLQLEPDVSSCVEFIEFWKNQASKHDYKDLVETHSINGLLLSVFQEQDSNGLVYILEHEDRSLVWIAELNVS